MPVVWNSLKNPSYRVYLSKKNKSYFQQDSTYNLLSWHKNVFWKESHKWMGRTKGCHIILCLLHRVDVNEPSCGDILKTRSNARKPTTLENFKTCWSLSRNSPPSSAVYLIAITLNIYAWRKRCAFYVCIHFGIFYSFFGINLLKTPARGQASQLHGWSITFATSFWIK